MSDEWYYSENDQQIGPVSGQQLLEWWDSTQRTIDPLVWREGMESWSPLSTVAHQLGSAAPAPTPAATVPTPTLTPSSTESPYATPQSFLDGATQPKAPANSPISPYGPYRDASGLTKAVAILLGVFWFISIASVISSFMQYKLLSDYEAGLYSDDEFMALATPNDIREGIIGVAFLLTYIPTVIVWCFWKNRVVKNAFSFGANWIRVSPGWAVGFYFIPIMLLFKPFQAMNDAWRASIDPKRGEGLGTAAVVGWWWGIWLIGNFVDNIDFRFSMQAETAAELANASIVSGIAAIVGIVVTPLAFFVVTGLNRLQRERAKQMGLA